MTIDEMITVLMAAKKGKAIECKRICMGETPWVSDVNPGWNFNNYKYRVKPEPRRFWATIGPHGKMISCVKPLCILEGDELIEVVEVLK